MKQLLEIAKRKGGARPQNAWNEQVEAYKSEWRDFIEPNKASNECRSSRGA